MPILTDPKDSDPLTQGDILNGIPLYSTSQNWLSGEPYKVKSPICMVISRPCVALQKPQVVVAAIQRHTEGVPKDLGSFEHVCEWLNQLRDGSQPDRFYLGQIPGYDEGRYSAMLDSLHTVKLPSSAELAGFLKTHRIAALHDDFKSDLHRRVFSSVAALGFDHHAWYADEDLAWLISVGETDIKKAEHELSQKKSEHAKNTADGYHEQRNQKLQGEIKVLETKVANLSEKLGPYRVELEKRRRAVHTTPTAPN